MEKMLHERLREYVENGCEGAVMINGTEDGIMLPSEARGLIAEIERDYISKSDHEKALNAMVEAQSGVNEPGYRSAHYVMETYAKSKGMPFEDGGCITDWLGRWFIRRPRFEDGEPVKLGDDTDKLHGVEKFIFTRSGGVSCQMQDADGVMHNVFPGELVKRPAPKIIDAEGVEVKVGDTVWPTESPGMQMTVGDLQNTYGLGVTVKCAFDGDIYNFNPRNLTHREPDSLEKLRDDLMTAHESWDGNPNKLVDYADRLTALIERGA